MSRLWFAGLLVATLVACGGPDIPVHNGYPAKAKPWRKAAILELDEQNQAEADATVSYPKRERAKWFAVDLPASGELDVDLTVTPIGTSQKGMDLAVEVLDEGFRVLTRADDEEDDAGDDEKHRTLYELAPGRLYLHVYTQARLDEADFTLAITFRPVASVSKTDFPAKVAYVGQLPLVPSKDDAPAPAVVHHKCRGAGCGKKPPKPEAPVQKSLKARISAITTGGGGTQIKINRGESDGIAVGWKGQVVTKDGTKVPGGGFSVSKVSSSESFATVKASSDAVTAAKYVRLRPP
jgi:hypothetical protein